MKTRIAFLSVLLLLSAAAYSQTEQGTFYLSGLSSMNFSRTTAVVYDGGNTSIDASLDINSFTLQSEFGYFIVKDLALGLALNYTSIKDFKIAEPDKTTETLLMPCLMYVIPLKSSLRPFVQIGGGLASVNQGEGYEAESFFGFVLAGVIGAKYFINETISMDLGVQLSSAKLTNEDDLELNTDNLTAGIGFSIYF